MTPEKIEGQLQDAEKRAAQGDLAGALSLCETLVKQDRTSRPAFRMYRKLYNAGHGRDLTHAEVFDYIYASHIWVKGSGLGSLPQTTETYRKVLLDFLKRENIRSVVDAGCGDWQFSQLIDWTGINYVGIDVSSVALTNNERYAAPNIKFIVGDIRTLDHPGADLLIMKDVLQHWSNADVLALIPKFARYRFCLITNGTSPAVEAFTNKDIPAGNWRPVDLALPPFSVPGQYVHSYDFTITSKAGVVKERKRVYLIGRNASLVLKRAPFGPDLNQEDYDVLTDGAVVGRIFFVPAA